MRSRLIFLIASVLAAAGARAATLSGSVHGSLGAAVPRAQVSVSSAAGAQIAHAETDDAGHYLITLPPGDYRLEVTAGGFDTSITKISIAGEDKIFDITLAPSSGNAAQPSLNELGFPAEQTQGNPAAQARLDKRSHMLKIHQRLGLITIAPLIATIIASSGAAGRHSTSTGRDIHAALGSATAALYFTTASFAIFAPKVPGTPTRGGIKIHKALAWIHGPGMVLTPVLGAIAFDQRSKGEKVHGIAQAHSAVAWVTAGAFAAAVLSVSVRF